MDLLNNVVFDKKPEDSAKRATDEDAWQKETSWHCCAISDDGEDEPDQEEEEEGLVAEDSFLAKHVFDHCPFRVEQKGCHWVVHSFWTQVLNVFGIHAALILTLA
jgi:hypothetical protein